MLLKSLADKLVHKIKANVRKWAAHNSRQIVILTLIFSLISSLNFLFVLAFHVRQTDCDCII